jgi:hypothetical protein
MALYMDVGANDLLVIGDTTVTVERKSGSRVRLRIIGKSDVQLVRDGKNAMPPTAPMPINQRDED